MNTNILTKSPMKPQKQGLRQRMKRILSSMILMIFMSSLMPGQVFDLLPKAEAALICNGTTVSGVGFFTRLCAQGDTTIQGEAWFDWTRSALDPTNGYTIELFNVNTPTVEAYRGYLLGSNQTSLPISTVTALNGVKAGTYNYWIASPSWKLGSTSGFINGQTCDMSDPTQANQGNCVTLASYMSGGVSDPMKTKLGYGTVTIIGPLIVTDPSNTAVFIGSPASFSITATNATSYQWYKNGILIPGATNSSFTIPQTIQSDAGNYSCAVKDSGGRSVMSKNATLTLLAPKIYTTYSNSAVPIGNPGNSGILAFDSVTYAQNIINNTITGLNGVAVSADGSKIYATFINNAVPVGNPGNSGLVMIDSTTHAITTINNTYVGFNSVAISPDGSKIYATFVNPTVAVGNPGNSGVIAFNSTAPYTATTINNTNAGMNSVAVNTDGSKIYVSYINSSISVGNPWNSGVIAFDTTAPYTSTSINNTTPGLNSVVVSPDGSKIYGTYLNSTIAPGNPWNSGVIAFSTTAPYASTSINNMTGGLNGIAINPDGSKIYATYLNSSVSPGNPYNSGIVAFNTTAPYASTSINNLVPGSNRIGMSVVSKPLPSITSQPASVTKNLGETATFSVTATNATSYQWQRNGLDIPGATSTSYTTPALIAEDNYARYSVTVTRGITSVASSGAILNINNVKVFAYGLNTGSNTVSVIDSITNQTIQTIGVGSGPSAIALTSDGKFAYVTNAGSNTVSIIDTITNQIVGTITGVTNPSNIALTSDGKFAYVANKWNNSVSIIYTVTKQIIQTFGGGSLFSWPSIVNLAISPDRKFIYVVKEGHNSLSIPAAVSVIDPNTGQQVGSDIILPACCHYEKIAFTPNGKFAYLANNYNGFTVIDTKTKIVGVINGVAPNDIAFTPDGKFAYVTNTGINTVSVIDTITNQIVGTINTGLGTNPGHIAIAPDGKFAYVTNAGINTVSVIDTITNQIVGTITGVTNPSNIAITPDGKFVYVTNTGINTVSVINTITNQIVGTITGTTSILITFASIPNVDSTPPLINIGAIKSAANTLLNLVSVTDTNGVTSTMPATIDGTAVVTTNPSDTGGTGVNINTFATTPASTGPQPVFTFSGLLAGINTFAITVKDMAGNISTDGNGKVYYDTQDPTINWTLNGASVTSPSSGTTWNKTAQVITAQCSHSIPGCSLSVNISANSGVAADCTTTSAYSNVYLDANVHTFTIPADVQMCAMATSASGRTSIIPSFPVLVDTSTPDLAITSIEAVTANKNVVRNGGGMQWSSNDTTPKVTFASSDTVSGIQSIRVEVLGTTTNLTLATTDRSFTFPTGFSGGTYNFMIIVMDKAGNQTVKVASITFDTTGPNLTGGLSKSWTPGFESKQLRLALPSSLDSEKMELQVINTLDNTPVTFNSFTTFPATTDTSYAADNKTVTFSKKNPGNSNSIFDSVITFLASNKGGSTFPGNITDNSLPKMNAAGVQIPYKMVLTAYDALGNTSQTILNPVVFDTAAPTFQGSFINFPSIQNVNGSAVTKDVVVPFNFTAIDNNNDGTFATSGSYCISTNGGASCDLSNGSQPFTYDAGTHTSYISGTFTLPANFNGPVAISIADVQDAGLNDQKIINFIHDAAAPTITKLVQVRTDPTLPTQDLTLDIAANDTVAISDMNIHLSSNGVGKYFSATPLLSPDGKTISGQLTIPYGALPGGLSEGNYTLSVTFNDKAGNVSAPATTPVMLDHTSPTIFAANSSYQITPSTISLALNVQDISTLKTFFGDAVTGTNLGKEAAVSNFNRVLSLANIALTGKVLPYVFTVTDEVTPGATFTVQDGLQLSGNKASASTYDISYVLNPGDSTAAVTVEITPPTGLGSVTTKIFTGNTGTVTLTEPAMGTYQVKTTVTVTGKAVATFTNTIEITEDLIAPKLNDAAFAVNPSTPGKTVKKNTNGIYVTNDNFISLSYQLQQYIEQSNPIHVLVNGVEVKTYGNSLNTNIDNAIFTLANGQNTYNVTFEDNSVPRNITTKTFTIIKDTTSPQPTNGSTSNINVYKGTTGVFTPNITDLLKVSIIGEYLTDATHAAILVNAQDQYDNAPSVVIKTTAGTTILASTAMDPVPGQAHSFELLKKDILLTTDMATDYTVEITSFAGTTKSVPVRIHQYINKPNLAPVTIPNLTNGATTVDPITALVTAQANSGISYKIVVDGIAGGIIDTGKTNFALLPVSIPLVTEGPHTVQIILIDELGFETPSPVANVFYDHSAPDIGNVIFTADTPTTKTLLQSGAWYTNTATPLIDFPITDYAGIGNNPAKAAVIVNGQRYAFTPNMKLPALNDGVNTIVLYAEDLAGNGKSINANITLDNHAATLLGTPQVAQVEDLPNPLNTMTFSLPGVTDPTNASSVGFSHLEIQLLNADDMSPLTVNGKFITSPYLVLDANDATTVRATADSNGSLPLSITYTDLAKDHGGNTPWNVAVRVRAVDLLGNASTYVASNSANFDILPPTFQGAVGLKNVPSLQTNGVSTYYTTADAQKLIFNLQEHTNTGRTVSMPMTLKGYVGAPQALSAVSTFLVNQTIASEGQGELDFTLPASYTGDINFVALDAAGNVSSTNVLHTYFDTTAPAVGPTVTPVLQVTTNGAATKDLILQLSMADTGALSPVITLLYGTTTKDITLPAGFFTNPDHRNIEGTLTLTAADIPGFPQGPQDALKVVFYDIAGNPFTTPLVHTNVDWFSPIVTNVSYAFTNNKQNLDLTFTVQDTSLVNLLPETGTTAIYTESSKTGDTRTLTIPSFALSGTSPFTFQVTDGLTSPALITVQDGFSISRGAPDQNKNVPLTYTLTPADNNATVQLSITGPAGSSLTTPINQPFTGTTGSLNLSQPSKGTYKVVATVISGANTTKYEQDIVITEDLIPIALDMTKANFRTKDGTKKVNLDVASSVYHTNDNTILLDYQLFQTLEESYPVRVLVNNTEVKKYDTTLPTGLETIEIPMGNPNVQTPIKVEFKDNGGNTTTLLYTFVYDTQYAGPMNGTSLVDVYAGSLTNFVPNASLLLKKSSIANEYLTTANFLGLVINAQDEWNIPPRVSIKMDGGVSLTNVALTATSTPGSYIFTKGDLPLSGNSAHPIVVSVEDQAGNVTTQSFVVRQESSGPSFTALSATGNGTFTSNSAQVTALFSALSTSALRYEVYSGTTIIGSGTGKAEMNPMNSPYSYSLLAEGNNDIVVHLIDELGLRAVSNHFTVVRDTTPPSVNGVTVKATTPGTQSQFKNTKWFTNDPMPTIMVDATDGGSGLGNGATYSFKLNNQAPVVQSTPNYQLTSALLGGDNTMDIIITDSAGVPSPVKSIPIVFDNGNPEFTGVMTIKDIQDLPAPTHFVEIALPGVKDKDISGYGVSGVTEMQLQIKDNSTGIALSLTNKVQETNEIKISGTDTTIVILTQDAQGNWPSTIMVKDLPKATNSIRNTYVIELSAADLVGNKSTQVLFGISFDTQAPTFTQLPDFPLLPTKTIDGIMWYFTKNTHLDVSFGADEVNNAGRSPTLPMTLTVKDGSNNTLNTINVPSNGTNQTTAIDIPANIQGAVTFNISDKAGNGLQNQALIRSVWHDTTAPTALTGAPAAIYQDLGTAPANDNIPLTFKVQDAGTIASTATFTYNTTTKVLPIPVALFQNQDRTLDGTWILSNTDLPNFPEGATSILSVTLQDIAGNPLEVSNIAIKHDSQSPLVTSTVYAFKNNGQNIDLTLGVTDVSPLRLTYNGQLLNAEGAITGLNRTITATDIVLQGTGPYTFQLSDGINPSTDVVISNGFSASFGTPNGENLPLNYTLSGTGDLANATVALQITGPAGFTTINQNPTGATNTVTLTAPLMGNYNIHAVVTIPGSSAVTYDMVLALNQDIVAPKLIDTAYALNVSHAGRTLSGVGTTYYTNDTSLDLTYQFVTPSFEQSFPVSISINNNTVAGADLLSIPNAPQHLTIPLINPDIPTTYAIAFKDAAGNTTTKTITVVQDTRQATTVGTSTLVTAYVGSATFDPATAPKLKQSTLANELLTKDPQVALVVNAQDEWDIAPEARILKEGVEIIPYTAMTKTAVNTYTFTKKDADLTLNKDNTFQIEVRDISGNITTQTLRIIHDNVGPVINPLTYNDGKKETTTTANFGTVSVKATSSLTYIINVDGNNQVQSAWQTANPINAPLAFTLATEGDHAIILSVTDELGQTTTAPSSTLTLDSIKPAAKVTIKDTSGSPYLSSSIDNTQAADPIIFTGSKDRVTGNNVTLTIDQGQDAHFPIAITTENVPTSLNALYNKASSASLTDAAATTTVTVPLLNEGANTISTMLKDSFGNAHSAQTTIIRDTQGPVTTLSVSENPAGDLTWNWNYTDAQNTPILQARIALRNTTLGTNVALSKSTYDTTEKTFTLPANEVRRGETYALTLIATDGLGNDSIAQTVEITPISHTFDPFNPLINTPVTVPWQNYPDITQVKITMTDEQGVTYTATMPKTAVVDLPAFIAAASNGTKTKLPIGIYDVLIEPVTTRTDVVPAFIHQTITITPYYMDAGADLNGDGYGGGISDYTLYREAKKAGNIYALALTTPLTPAQQKQDEELKARGALIETIITAVLTTKLTEFMSN